MGFRPSDSGQACIMQCKKEFQQFALDKGLPGHTTTGKAYGSAFSKNGTIRKRCGNSTVACAKLGERHKRSIQFFHGYIYASTLVLFMHAFGGNRSNAAMVTMLSSASGSTANYSSFDFPTVDLQSIDLGEKLKELEREEEARIEQLIHLRDYYMLPLLGTPTPEETLRRATRRTVQRDEKISRANTSLFATFFRRRSTSGRRGRVDGDGTASTNQEELDAGSTSHLEKLQAEFTRLQVKQKQAVYKPTENSKAVIFGPFEALDQLIDVHSCFLEVLRTRQVSETPPHAVIPAIAAFTKQPSIHHLHVENMVDALRAFESLVFSDKKLAKIIDVRIHVGTVRVDSGANISYDYGTVGPADTFEAKYELDSCLAQLEQIAKRAWPALQEIAGTQRVAALQQRILGVPRSMLQPKQSIHIIDVLDVREFSEHKAASRCHQVYTILFTDRLLLLKDVHNRKQLNVYKSLPLAETSFAFSRVSEHGYASINVLQHDSNGYVQFTLHSKEQTRSWRHCLKRLSTIHTSSEKAFAALNLLMACRQLTCSSFTS
ncbi:hypothetical protein THASP1DRAFT_22941 [Thamnocephalis sphaerospora]|uniref:PH domain-containing protein n=1 Tax=Thamnocephalis sphaerospora TaxID=78915 RepID=A0A4P9XSS6_9FUNG|nr:hypothetical protein THASP1DRAFT_22941 [Thamnocephalis sphaerospora]|eukprot:RKP09198.1 hypothetical protein THASP1DRAFT_22941 [Thamnocephalis sphaerospora]